MVSNILAVLQYLEIGSAVAVFLYGAYWGLSIRRALAVSLYRSQALGISLICLFLGFAVLDVSTANASGPVGYFAAFGIFVPGALIFLYWIDTSVLVSRRSDPLLRDTFHWSRVRFVAWGWVVIASLVDLSIALFFLISTGNIPDSPDGLINYLARVTPQFVVAVPGTLLLPITAQRSKDMAMRRHLTWFGIAVILILVFVIIPAFIIKGDAFLVNTLAFSGLLATGYSLYRSARSLAPLNTLSLPD